MSRFDLAKDYIKSHLEAVVAELLHGKQKFKRKGSWNVRNPYRPGSKEEQMVVWLAGNRRGAWKDYAGTDKGDAIDLVAFALTGSVDADSRMAAVEWAEDRWGLKTMDSGRRQQLATEARTRTAAAEATDQRRREKSIARARKFFFSCVPSITGTIAETYIKADRGVTLAQVLHMGRSLRFRHDCEYWMQAARPRVPAMVAAMVDVHGKIGACHYTFLKPDGSAKAGLIPETAGLVIRLTNGSSGLSAEDAAAQGVAGLGAICEGIEDGISIARAEPDLRVWPCGSLAGLRTVPDHPAINGWIVFKDNDWGKPQAAEQFDLAIARLKSFRKPVEVVSMPADWGKDVNDAIRSGW